MYLTVHQIRKLVVGYLTMLMDSTTSLLINNAAGFSQNFLKFNIPII